MEEIEFEKKKILELQQLIKEKDKSVAKWIISSWLKFKRLQNLNLLLFQFNTPT